MTEEKYVDLLDEEIESGSGGGIVGQIQILPGFKCFISGLSPAETTFTYSTKAEKAGALAAAEKLYTQLGIEKKPQQTVVMIQYKDSVVGRDVSTWQDDAYHTYGMHWGANAKKLNELRKALGIDAATKVWARTGRMTCPDAEAAKTGEVGEPSWAWEKGQDGEPQLRRMVIPVEVYANKAEAEAGASSTNSVEEIPPGFPGGEWKPADWLGFTDTFKESVAKLVAESSKPAPIAKKEAYIAVAAEYAGDGSPVTAEHIQAVCES